MSGGHWGYQSTNLLIAGELSQQLTELVSELEQTLDWGICGDTNLLQAERVTLALIYAFFESRWGDENLAKAFDDYISLRDHPVGENGTVWSAIREKDED